MTLLSTKIFIYIKFGKQNVSSSDYGFSVSISWSITVKEPEPESLNPSWFLGSGLKTKINLRPSQVLRTQIETSSSSDVRVKNEQDLEETTQKTSGRYSGRQTSSP